MGAATVLGQTVTEKQSRTLHSLRKAACCMLWPLVVAYGSAQAQTQPTAATVVVSGLGGSPEYDEQFDRYGSAIADAARQLTPSDEAVVHLQGAQATKGAILDALTTLQQLSSDDSVRLFLLGHGSFDGSQYKYNIPGPDLTGEELAEALGELPMQQLVVLSTSASGALLEPLQAGNRVVITATKNGRERNAVRFTEFLAAGLTDPAADTDKDEIINADELYQFAERAVATYYEGEKLLASEHARINGDASGIELARYGSLLANQSDISEELIAQRKEISDRIANLRTRKDDLTEDDYFDQLQTLMLELATVQREIDEPADEPAVPADNAQPTGTSDAPEPRSPEPQVLIREPATDPAIDNNKEDTSVVE